MCHLFFVVVLYLFYSVFSAKHFPPRWAVGAATFHPGYLSFVRVGFIELPTGSSVGSSIQPTKDMFGSPPIDSHRLRNRDLRRFLPSPRTTVVLRGNLS